MRGGRPLGAALWVGWMGHWPPLPWQGVAPVPSLRVWGGWVAGRPRLGGGWHRHRPLFALRAISGNFEYYTGLLRGKVQPARALLLLVQSSNSTSVTRLGTYAAFVLSLAGAARGLESSWHATRCEAPPLARCCACCACSRCLCARVPARIAMLSQRVAVVQVCSVACLPAIVLPLMLPSCALQGKCGLCGVLRACTMAEPCSHGSFLVRARGNGPEIGRSEACVVFLCSGWCCVPLWAHSTSTCTFACTRRPGCCQHVLPWPYARERAADASLGGLASERVPGEWGS